MFLLTGQQLPYFDVAFFMLKVLDIPLTVKMRTGISDKKTSWNAHKLISNLKMWDVSLVTVSVLDIMKFTAVVW